MSRREVRWERMFRDELEAAFAECPMVYLPYGLCEPHGPQNALGMDALRAHGISCLTAHAEILEKTLDGEVLRFRVQCRPQILAAIRSRLLRPSGLAIEGEAADA